MSEASNIIPMPNSTAARIAETGVLLDYPRWIGGPERHDVVYGLVGGRVGTAPLARYRLPERLRGAFLIGPSPMNTDALDALPVLAEIADRIAPWLSVHVVPHILTRRGHMRDFGRASGCYEIEGAEYVEACGVACYDERLILIEPQGSPAKMASTLLHEIFHHVWHRHLSDAACDVLSAAVADGAQWPGSYFDATYERTARLFQGWAWARLEGMPADPDAAPMSVEGLFEFIWSGALADHQIARGLVPGHEALMRRRGLHPLPPPEPEPLPAPPRGREADPWTDWVWMPFAAGARGIGRASVAAWRKMAAAA